MAKLIKCPMCKKKLSPAAPACPHCGHPMQSAQGTPPPKKKKKLGCLDWGLVIFIGLGFFGVVLNNKDEERKADQQPKPTATPAQNKTPKALQALAAYTIPSKQKTVLQLFQDVSEVATQISGWVLVECSPKLCGEAFGTLVSFHLSSSIGDITPVWHVSPEFTLACVNGKAHGYTPDLPLFSVPSIPGILAAFTALPKNHWSPTVDIANAPKAQPRPTPTPEPMSAEEEKRFNIYKEVADAELKAIHEADAKFPDFGEKHMEHADKMSEQYRQEILQRHGLTEDQFLNISVEAFEKAWNVD